MIDISSITSAPSIIPTTSKLTARDHWDHFLARVGVKRGDHRVQPGLYSLGIPTPDSPVFVTANYSLSFDALRASLAGIDGYILVLTRLASTSGALPERVPSERMKLSAG
jgi:hypothetical protein